MLSNDDRVTSIRTNPLSEHTYFWLGLCLPLSCITLGVAHASYSKVIITHIIMRATYVNNDEPTAYVCFPYPIIHAEGLQ